MRLQIHKILKVKNRVFIGKIMKTSNTPRIHFFIHYFYTILVRNLKNVRYSTDNF